MHQSAYRNIHRPPALMLLLSVATALTLITACATPSKQGPIDLVQCLDSIPKKVEGLKILSGPRSERSIIHDLVPAICYGHVLYDKMKASGEDINAGQIVMRVAVEYTGEVYEASVVETTIGSERFVKKVSDYIMDTDFVGWARDKSDTEFIYKVAFGRKR